MSSNSIPNTPTSSIPEYDSKQERQWAVKVPNTEFAIGRCVEIGAQYNDFKGVIKFQNFYYLLFNGYSDKSADGFRKEGFVIKEVKEFIHKKGAIHKAVYMTDPQFKGFAIPIAEFMMYCIKCYRGDPELNRLQDLGKPEIDFVDEPTDTTDIKILKTNSYIAKCMAIIKSLPKLLDDKIISEQSLDYATNQMKDNIEKLKYNLSILENNGDISTLHPFIKWNRVMVQLLGSENPPKTLLEIVAVDVMDSKSALPTIKIRLNEVPFEKSDQTSETSEAKTSET